MKCILAMVCFSFLIGGTAVQPVFAKDAPASEPQLLQEFVKGSVLSFETNPFAWFAYFAVHFIRLSSDFI
jgi:hypothetical protein